jgi:ketosteroid isomerase-like protein
VANPVPEPDRAGGRLELIRHYFASCSSGTAKDIAACFTDDAVIYDTNLAPVSGSSACGDFWVRVRRRWEGAHWQVDRGVEQGDDAACEWTMTGSAHGRAVVFRGSDHYRFVGDLIAEVRQYWTFDDSRLTSGLLGYAYGSPADAAGLPTA